MTDNIRIRWVGHVAKVLVVSAEIPANVGRSGGWVVGEDVVISLKTVSR